MTATLTREPKALPPQSWPPPDFKRETTVYAITFDMDIDQLRLHYGDPYNNAYQEIRRVLEKHRFKWQQGSVYFGDRPVSSTDVTRAVIALVRQLPWFAACVRDIRQLRIEEFNDLLPVVRDLATPT